MATIEDMKQDQAGRLEWLAALVGAVDCVLVPLVILPGQDSLFPLPGLYLLEIAMLGLAGLVSVVKPQSTSDSPWRWVPWGAAGILLAFNVLGAWTIGLFLIPGTVGFLLAGVLGDRRWKRPLWPHLGFFLITALAQAVLVVGVVALELA